jgi:NhaP-type Na+/H+ or K+/H+ antiporter
MCYGWSPLFKLFFLERACFFSDATVITLFQTLVNRYDGRANHDALTLDEIFDCVAQFLNIMSGSIAVGLLYGGAAYFFFWKIGKDLSQAATVWSFFLWALIPCYVSTGIGYSGGISIGTIGFVMDVFITTKETDRECNGGVDPMLPQSVLWKGAVDSDNHDYPPTLFSAAATQQVRFVALFVSRFAENAIFAYLGVFFFSRDDGLNWDLMLVAFSVLSSVIGRLVMILVVSLVTLVIYKCWFRDNNEHIIQLFSNPNAHAVLVLAGLRGVLSLALLVDLPIYSHETGEGCEYKQLMKAMTVASILFTTFLFGGSAQFTFPVLGASSILRKQSVRAPNGSNDNAGD